MVIKIFSYQKNDLSRNLLPLSNTECFIHIINNCLKNLESSYSLEQLYDKLEEIKSSVFILDLQKKIIEDKLQFNLKLRWMFKNMLFRKRLRNAYDKKPWNDKTAVGLSIDDIPEEERITIISHGKRFIFHAWELIKTIDISLHGCSQFSISPEPAKPINAFTGAHFTLWELSSIFNQFATRNMQLPLYLMLFKDSGFDLDKMVFRNQYLISINTIKSFINEAQPDIILREIMNDIKTSTDFSINNYLDESELWEQIDLLQINTLCPYCIKSWIYSGKNLHEIKSIIIRRTLLSNKLETRNIYTIKNLLQSPNLDIIKYIIQDKKYNEIVKENHKQKIKIDLSSPPQSINLFLKHQQELHARVYLKGKKANHNKRNKLKKLNENLLKNKRDNDVIKNWYLYTIGLKRVIETNQNNALKYVKNSCENIVDYNDFINKLNRIYLNSYGYYKSNKNILIHEYWGKINELENSKNINSTKCLVDKNNEVEYTKSIRYPGNMYKHFRKYFRPKERRRTDADYIKSLY